jgi:hypothetical protein
MTNEWVDEHTMQVEFGKAARVATIGSELKSVTSHPDILRQNLPCVPEGINARSSIFSPDLTVLVVSRRTVIEAAI